MGSRVANGGMDPSGHPHEIPWGLGFVIPIPLVPLAPPKSKGVVHILLTPLLLKSQQHGRTPAAKHTALGNKVGLRDQDL